jgi:hypothetical protein
MIAYTVLDRLYVVAIVGRVIEITPAYAMAALVVGSLWIWAILALAGVA